MGKIVVITGIGVVSPNSIGKDDFNQALKEGRPGIRKITLFDTSGLRCKTAGEITDFKPEAFLGKKGLRTLNRSTRLALAAAGLALDDGGIKSPVDKDAAYDYGVSLGTATGSMKSIMDFDRDILLEGPNFTNPALFPNTVMNVAASYASIRFNIKGFNSTIASSLCSGADAIFYAVSMIKNYNYKVAIAGGVDELCLETFMGFYKTGFLSGSRPNTEEFLSAPYDKRRNGAIYGEGACILLLEDLEHAIKRNARIYARIDGYGNSFDPRSGRMCNLRADGAALAINKALSDSDTGIDKIDCIYGSANSTPDGDAMEANAINRVFKDKAKSIYVTSVKSMLGETFSAGAVFSIAACVLGMSEGFIPPTINYSLPDRRCSLNIVKDKAMEARVDKALVNSFSGTGSNSTLLISRFYEG